jgi:hypothetical protein
MRGLSMILARDPSRIRFSMLPTMEGRITKGSRRSHSAQKAAASSLGMQMSNPPIKNKVNYALH